MKMVLCAIIYSNAIFFFIRSFIVPKDFLMNILILTVSLGFALIAHILIEKTKMNNNNNNNKRPLMASNVDKGKCPKCSAIEVDAMTPRTVYECGSSDYDQRPNTFNQSEECKRNCS